MNAKKPRTFHRTDADAINALFAASAEWLLLDGGARGFALKNDEIAIEFRLGALWLEFQGNQNWQIWRVAEWQFNAGRLIFECFQKFGARNARFEFVPRVSAGELRENIEITRKARVIELAQLARGVQPLLRIERARLSPGVRAGEPGRWAQILVVKPNQILTAVFASVVAPTNVASLLSASICWFQKLGERRARNQPVKLWLIVETAKLEELQRLRALLGRTWRETIEIYELIVSEQTIEATDSGQSQRATSTGALQKVAPLAFPDLWRERTRRIAPPTTLEISQTASRIVELAPEKIDAARSRYGETVRFHGLPFARVRQIFGGERAWFGLDGKRRETLDETNLGEFEKLFDNLLRHRRADVEDRRNSLYKAAPEAWLESILRRDITRLDPNLILAPLYAQFRSGAKARPIDLLALRTDGRLVVIELKVSPNRNHVFQAVDYWRAVELHRRRGNLKRARLFGDLTLADAPPLVYLVAPLMSFHRDFELLARTIAPEIELWRFDLNEDWRAGVRVARRLRVS